MYLCWFELIYHEHGGRESRWGASINTVSTGNRSLDTSLDWVCLFSQLHHDASRQSCWVQQEETTYMETPYFIICTPALLRGPSHGTGSALLYTWYTYIPKNDPLPMKFPMHVSHITELGWPCTWKNHTLQTIKATTEAEHGQPFCQQQAI